MNSDKELLRLIEHLPMEDFERIIVTEIIKGEEDEKILKKSNWKLWRIWMIEFEYEIIRDDNDKLEHYTQIYTNPLWPRQILSKDQTLQVRVLYYT